MAERGAIVLACASEPLRLRVERGICRDCTLGCGNRCTVFPTEGQDLVLGGQVPGLRPGDRVVLQFDDDDLRRAAWFRYARVLAGALLGAAPGFGLGRLSGYFPAALTWIGLAAGTFSAVFLSKPHVPAPRALLHHPPESIAEEP